MSKNTNITKSDVLNSSPVALKSLVALGPMAPREFKTGSVGYYATGKVVLLVGGKPCSFQVGGNLIVCGTKAGSKKAVPADKVAEFLASGPKTLEQLGLGEALALPKDFSTGSVGYRYDGKTALEGLTLQVGLNIIAVDSKEWGKAEEQKEAEAKASAKSRLEAMLA